MVYLGCTKRQTTGNRRAQSYGSTAFCTGAHDRQAAECGKVTTAKLPNASPERRLGHFIWSPMKRSLRVARVMPLFGQHGFSFIDVSLSMVVFLLAMVSLLVELVATVQLNESYRAQRLAWVAAIDQMEQLTKAAYSDYQTFLDTHRVVNGTTFTVTGLNPNDTMGVIRLCTATLSLNGDHANTLCASAPSSDDDVVVAYVTVCFRDSRSHVIGEDLDLDGILDAGEDQDGDSLIDSPVQLATRFAR